MKMPILNAASNEVPDAGRSKAQDYSRKFTLKVHCQDALPCLKSDMSQGAKPAANTPKAHPPNAELAGGA